MKNKIILKNKLIKIELNKINVDTSLINLEIYIYSK